MTRYRESMRERRTKRTWLLAAMLFLVGGALTWAVTHSVVWLGVGVAFAVMFAVVATGPRDER